MKKTLPFLWRYLAVVMVSCLLAFVISQSKVDASVTVKNNGVAAPANTVAMTSVGPYDTPGEYDVAATEAVWHDAARQRDIPVRIISPSVTQNKMAGVPGTFFPVILFSHGLGGSREGGAIWGQHWASHGYIVLHLQHAGSDDAIWKGKSPNEAIESLKVAYSIENSRLRIGDVNFALDEIARLKQSKVAPWGNADLSRIGMSGHSFGSQTTLAVAGQKLPMPGFKSTRDDRIKAAIAFSPNARLKTGLDAQFGSISMPFFSITGTKDTAVMNDGTKAEDRLIPYQKMLAGEKYLTVFEGGDHMVFGGHGLGGRRPETARDREIQADVKAGTQAFWDSTLKQDVAAKKWLTSRDGSGFKSMLIAGDVFENK